MFVRNHSSARIALAKGHLTDTLAVGAIVVETVYRVSQTRLERTDEPPARDPRSPPDTSRKVLWHEVSVTASGTAFGPPRAPFLRPASLTIGQERVDIVVFGPRRWRRTLGGDLEPSAPEPFEAIPLSWERAFGGGYEIPPGIEPSSGLPHPGLRVQHPFNRSGVGYYRDQQAAADRPLPDIERAAQRIARWNDQPAPAGLSPCPDLHALRLPPRYGGRGRDLARGSTASDPMEAMFEDSILVALRNQHHAPGDLVLAALPPGTAISLLGLGRAPLQFEVPPSPVDVRARRRRHEEAAPPKLRSLHVDADHGTLTVVYGHAFTYDPATPPSWVHVTATS
jgi:hypothetical protein